MLNLFGGTAHLLHGVSQSSERGQRQGWSVSGISRPHKAMPDPLVPCREIRQSHLVAQPVCPPRALSVSTCSDSGRIYSSFVQMVFLDRGVWGQTKAALSPQLQLLWAPGVRTVDD